MTPTVVLEVFLISMAAQHSIVGRGLREKKEARMTYFKI